MTRKTSLDWRGTAKNRAALFCGAAVSFLFYATGPLAAQNTAPPPVKKVYGRTPQDSSPPEWPQEKKAPKGAPNIFLIMTDDVGFGASSAFGGAIPTPTFDALASQGIAYNNFNTTAICSPTRASLLTGRNPQAVGMGYVTNWATAYDGYNSVIPKSAGTVAQILKQNGYNTAMFGKGHITPEWEMSTAGPFDRWPTGLGFEYFYGFLGADTSMFEPSLVENTRYADPPGDDPGYHLDKDLADRAIRWLSEQHAVAPDKPFLIYYATGTAHAPNQAPREWLEKFRGKFDEGWDKLRARTVARAKALGVVPKDAADAPRPENLPKWDSLSADQKRVYARFMEAYAASLAYADHEIGRVLQHLRDEGELDNTLVIYVQGDNGASAEGSFDGKLFEQSALSGIKEDFQYTLAHIDDIGTAAAYNLNPGGWGWAMNAPFPWAKRYASHFGGTRNALVMSWPEHIKPDGRVRPQYHHVSDIMPTILEATGIEAPAMLDGVPQQPITGISMKYTFDAPKAASHRTMQVYGMTQNLSIYQNGWVAATKPMVTPWEKVPPKPIDVNQRTWQLYNVAKDFSEADDLAGKHPRKLAEMKELFWSEAAKAGILPIHASEGHQHGRPDLNADRSVFVYPGPLTHIPETAAPRIVGNSFTMTARIVVPNGGASGVLAAQGGRYGGYSLFLHNGSPAFTYNVTPAHVTRIQSPSALAPGAHSISVDFDLDGATPGSGARVRLSVDGKEVANGAVDHSFPLVVSHTEGFDIGEDTISAVDDSYSVESSRFNGQIDKLTVTLK